MENCPSLVFVLFILFFKIYLVTFKIILSMTFRIFRKIIQILEIRQR